MINDAQLTDSNSPAKLPRQGLTTRVVRGSLWNLSSQGVTAMAAMVATPFVIRLLGVDSYGVLALINILIGYLSFADMGMGMASTRFASEAYARGDEDGEATAIWSALLLAAVPALIVSLVLVLVARQLVEHWLRVPAPLAEATVFALRLAALGFFARAIAGVLNTPELVRLRMDLFAYVNVGTSVGQILVVPVVLYLGGGLTGAVMVMASAAIAAAFWHLIIGIRLLPALSRPQIKPTLLRPLARFGTSVVISSIAAMALMNAEKLLLPRYASIRELAYYTVAFNLSFMLTQAPLAMAQSLLPAFSQLQAGSDRTALKQLYQRALRGTLYWVAPAAVCICIVGTPFLTLWAGPEFGLRSTLPLWLLAVGLIWEVMAYPPYVLLVALGRTDLIARCNVAVLLPYLVVSAVLISWFGAAGAAIGWSLRAFTSAVTFALLARHQSGFSFSPWPDNKGAYSIALLTLLASLLLAWLMPASVLIRFGLAFATLAIYSTIIFAQVLNDEERNQILRMLPFVPWGS